MRESVSRWGIGCTEHLRVTAMSAKSSGNGERLSLVWHLLWRSVQKSLMTCLLFPLLSGEYCFYGFLYFYFYCSSTIGIISIIEMNLNVLQIYLLMTAFLVWTFVIHMYNISIIATIFSSFFALILLIPSLVCILNYSSTISTPIAFFTFTNFLN